MTTDEVSSGSGDILFEVRGRIGRVTLNRPRAINALTHEMVVRLHSRLDAWADDEAIAAVLIDGAGERGLCAGGDIVSLYRDAVAGDDAGPAAFWRDEYLMNAAIARYPKPYAAIMDGIVLGGGIGVSAHGSHRIVTERSRLGMPETGIGFVPDVGGTWLLSHAPGETGTMLALTAGSMPAADAIAAGFADAFVPSDRLAELVGAIEAEVADAGTLNAVIERFAEDSGAPRFAGQREWIDEVFRGDSLAEIVARAAAGEKAGARAAAEAMSTKSPTAMAVALASLRRVADMGRIEQALIQEYRVSLRAFAAPDFAEGIRAQVIDKDRKPAWHPPAVEDVTSDAVDAYFAPLGERERELALSQSHR